MLLAMRRVVLSQIFEQIGLPVILIIMALYFIFSAEKLGFLTAFTVHGLTYATIALICITLVMKTAGINFSTPAKYETKKWVKVAVPLGIASVSAVLISRMDILFVGFFVLPEEIAKYGVASRVAGLMIFGLAAVGAVTAPRISEMYYKNELDEISELLKKIIKIMTVCGILALTLLYTFGDWILLAFGAEYVKAKHLMIILSLGQVFNLSAGPISPILTVSGNQKSYMKTLLFIVICFALVLPVAINNYGLVGAAVTTSIVTVVMNFSLIRLIKRKTGISVF